MDGGYEERAADVITATYNFKIRKKTLYNSTQ
jgi:hypothetical protein